MQWVGQAESWLPCVAWDKLSDSERGEPAPGETVCLAFDGSAIGESTALIGCTLDGDVFTVAIWQAPDDDPRGRVPRGEVADRIDQAMRKWGVGEIAADTGGWRSKLAEGRA